MEAYELPVGVFHYLHTMVLNQSRSEEGKEEKVAEQFSDELEQTMM